MRGYGAVVDTEPITELRESHVLLVQRHQFIDLSGAQKGLSLPTARTTRPRESVTVGSDGRSLRLYAP